MISKKKIISIITARSGSKGLPKKNIKKLKNIPLLNYTIKAAVKSNIIDRIILSTDSKEIAKIGKKAGAEIPFLRPKKLAMDKSHHPEVVEHAVSYIENKENIKFDIVLMLQPTSPFRTELHLDQAIKSFLKNNYDTMISIKNQDYPPWWMFSLKGNKLNQIFNFKKNINVFNLERQQFTKLYRPNGAIYICNREYLKNNNNLVNPNSCGYYLMDEIDSIDIDNKIDFMIAELMFTKWKNKHKKKK